MFKKRKLAFFLIVAAVLLIALVGCTFNIDDLTKKVSVESIQMDDTQIILATSGTYSVKDLQPTVLPENASNKNVTYKVMDNDASAYFTVSAGGRLKSLGEEVPDEEYYKVRITSDSNPSVYIDVFVTVMEAVVKRISFGSERVTLNINEPPVQVELKITPYFAVVDNINYEVLSLDEDIISVSATGLITPLAIGQSTVRAYVGTSTSEIQAFLTVVVKYPPLNYQISIRNNQKSALKQIAGRGEIFHVDVWKNQDDPCDDNPDIKWYLNDTEIQDSLNIRGFFNIEVDPDTIGFTLGENRLKAVLESGEDKQELAIPVVNVYNPLEHFNATIQNSQPTYNVNDVLNVVATHRSGEYPPDSYEWYYVRTDDPSQTEYSIGSTEPVNGEGVLYYTLMEQGEFRIICYPIIKQTLAGVRADQIIITVGQAVKGNDISGVYVDGAFSEVDQQYVPFIKWDALPYDASYKVHLSNGSDELVISSLDPVYIPYFTENGLYVPQSFATLSDSFSFRVQSSRYGYGPTYQYDGDIDIAHADRLDKLNLSADAPDFNGYIVNLEEFADLINYVYLFRPSGVLTSSDAETETFTLSLYFALSYNAIKDEYPDINFVVDISGTTPERANALRLVELAFNCYCETASFGMDAQRNGEYMDITLRFDKLCGADEYLSTSESQVLEYSFRTHYTDNPDSRQSLPIDSLSREMVVSTSNQLYYAVSKGYKPNPVPNSDAEALYEKASEVLFRIIDNGMTQAQKIHAIYDYLTLELVYDYELANSVSQTVPMKELVKYRGFYMEGVFFDGKAVCDGIAKAFTLLSWMEGISTKKVSGSSSDGVGHAWNISLINGEWYLNDATWGNILSNDGYYEMQTHAYLLTTDSDFADNHVTYGKYPKTATERNDVYIEMKLQDTYAVHIKTNADAENLAPYVDQQLDISTVWIEVYVAASYISANGNRIDDACQQLLSTIQAELGYGLSASYVKVGGGGFVILKINKA